MNILITGMRGTGKTVLAEIILPYLKAQGQVVTMEEKQYTYSRPKPYPPDFSFLEKTKSNDKYHFIGTTQSLRYVYPTVLGQMDMIINLQSEGMGQWLYQLSKGIGVK